jgi:hypothetical protein
MLARGWVIDDDHERVATGQGSLDDYDPLVPVIVLPPGRAHHPAQDRPRDTLDMSTIAPMLAGWLGVPLPRRIGLGRPH